MRLIKCTSFIILMSLLIPLHLFSWISSRVEGTIVDEETGQPIAGAYVGLFHCSVKGIHLNYTLESPDSKSPCEYIQTNDKGYFKFDDLHESDYFLAVFKEGYAAVGPFFYKKPDLFEERSGYAKSSQIERFHLKEGQIKHFKIQMEKEAILEVNVLRKTFEGIEPIDEFDITVQHPGFLEEYKANVKQDSNEYPVLKKNQLETNMLSTKRYIPTDAGFKTIYFKKGTVNLTIYPNGYQPETFEGVQLEKGEVKLVEFVVDFTKPPVVYGIIKNKDTGEPFHAVDIFIQKQDEPNKYSFINSHTFDGKYWLGSMEPGKYKFNIYSIGGDKEFDVEMFINITTTSIIEINKEF